MQAIKVRRTQKIVALATAFLAIIAAVVVVLTLFSPTPAPSKKSLDYLRIVRALSAIQSRVEAQKSAAAPLSNLIEPEQQQALKASDGMIRQVSLRPDGAIWIQATVGRQESPEDGTPVTVLLTPEIAGGKLEWRCLGNPTSALPAFCGKLG